MNVLDFENPYGSTGIANPEEFNGDPRDCIKEKTSAEEEQEEYWGEKDSIIGRIAKETPKNKEGEIEAAKLHAQTIKNAVEYLIENSSDPQEIEDFWTRFEEASTDGSERSKMHFKDSKYEILSRVATVNLLVSLKEKIAKDIDFNLYIEPSSPEEETLNGISFWIKTERKVRKKRNDVEETIKKRMPVHVSYVDLKAAKGEKLNKDKEVFAKKNFITSKCPTEFDFNRLGNSISREKIEREIRTFYGSNVSGDKISICFPIFREDNIEKGNFSPYQDDKLRKRKGVIIDNNTVSYGGKPSESIFKFFNKEVMEDRNYHNIVS